MIVAGSDCFDWEGGETLIKMGKDEKTATTTKTEDVEEGEISDTASVEEISEEDFNKQEVKSPRQSKDNVRVWTMNDLYKFQMGGGYVTGLYNLAWAQAVQNKPLTELFVEVEQTDENSKRSSVSPSSSVNSSGKEDKKAEKVVIDVSADEMDCEEKEEGELEEGEIDLDSDVVEKDKDGLVSSNEQTMNVVGGSEIECKEEKQEVDRKVDSIREALDSITVVEAEKSFEAACSKLRSAMESLQEVVGEIEVPTKDSLVQLSFAVIQTLHTVCCTTNYKLIGQNKAVFSRLLSVLNSHDNPIFSPEQMKEICSMVSSVDSPVVSLSSGYGEKNKDKQTPVGLNKKDADALANGAGYDITATNELLPATESFVRNKSNKSLEAPKQVVSSFKSRGVMLPLLDLHKVHDADSLPSPTRESTPSLPVNRVLPAGDEQPKSALPKPKVVLESQNLKMHPYETDALKAVSSYQQKFGRSSFFMNDRLPSPTPSEESGDGDGDIGGEVSTSSILGNAKSLNPPILGQESTPSSVLGNPGVQEVISAKDAAPVGSIAKASAKSRDPRLRFINSDANAPKVEPVGDRLSSRKHKASEDPLLDGSSLKRQRNGLDNSGVIRDVKPVTGSGGWLEDMDVVASETFSHNRLAENAGCDAKRIENGVPVCGKSTLNIDGNEHLPTIGSNTTIDGIGQVPPMGTSTASLPDLLKDIAENPVMLMNLIKLGQQQRQMLTDPAKSAMPSSISDSILGAIPAVNVTSLQSPGILARPAGAHQVASQIPKPDEVGQIRMKPRDPRRVLHCNSLERTGSLGSEQLKTNVTIPSTAQLTKEDQNVQKHDNQAELKLLSSHSLSPPDISLPFTKSLKNLADIVSVSQSSMTPPQYPALQPVQIKSDRVDFKPVTPDSDQQTISMASTPQVVAAASHSQNTWGDVEHLFDGYDDQQKAAIQRERARRIEEQKKMFAARKLCLVLDLDHTLLNSAKFTEVDPVHDEILRKKEEQDREKPQRHIFRFPHMGMWTKLRPGIWNFLEKASKLYELHLYTMGNKLYATEMAKLLDPKGDLFAGRVISRGDDSDPFDSDDRAPKSKDLEGVLGMESAVVIIDDSVRVWPHNKLNLIVVERYIYFPCSRRQFGLLGPSLLEIDVDERAEDGTLACSLAVIERIHQEFFTHYSLEEADVRNILASEQRKILSGCRILFSRVIPIGEANPHLHPLWQTAEQFGAVCTNQIDDQVTHVVANSHGTDKVNWALSSGKHVVYPGWVEASALLYRRANEQDFAIKP